MTCTFRGKMFLWDLVTGELLQQKQLYGRIERVVWKAGYIATAHTALSFDAGCVLVREYKGKSDS